MAKLWAKTLCTCANASGAAVAAREGRVVMIVDVVDMSTTAEAALEAGVRLVLGASPDHAEPPVDVNPKKIGYLAGCKASEYRCEIVVAGEPRLPTAEGAERRRQSMGKVLEGIDRAGAGVEKIVPNLGREVADLVDFKDKILLIVSSSGGTAFDAAFNSGAPAVVTGTVARTAGMSGNKPARAAAARVIRIAAEHRCGIALVAASSNSLEDLLAVDYIEKMIIDFGFLSRNSGNGQ
ncbi:MAG: hypothetical protein ACOCQC_01195 [Halanaerobiaceae bacterium]